MASSELILAVDIGTTNTKLALFNTDGRMVWRCQKRCETANSEGLHEVDPESWWNAICAGISEIESNSRKRIIAISAIAQGPTIILMSEKGHVLQKAVTWMDQRGSEFIDEALSVEPDRQLARVLCKLMDLEPVVSEPAVLLQPADFVNFKLTGILANSSFSAVGFLPWRQESLSSVGLDRTFQLPELVGSGGLVGKILPSVASQLELPDGVVVVAGSPDFAAALVGTNTVKDGDLCDRGGTSQGITLCSKLKVEIKGLLTTPYFLEDHWKISGLMSTTGKSLEWFQESVVQKDLSIKELTVQRPTGVVFLPYLSGERSPHWDNNARGVFFGLDLDSDTAVMCVSIMEGVAYGMAQIIERMERAACGIHRIRTTGGQAQSSIWNQIKADVIGKAIEVPEVLESELLGAAIYAISCLAKKQIMEVSNELFRTRTTVLPDTQNREIYRELLTIYNSLYERNVDLLHRLVVAKRTSREKIFTSD